MWLVKPDEQQYGAVPTQKQSAKHNNHWRLALLNEGQTMRIIEVGDGVGRVWCVFLFVNDVWPRGDQTQQPTEIQWLEPMNPLFYCVNLVDNAGRPSIMAVRQVIITMTPSSKRILVSCEWITSIIVNRYIVHCEWAIFIEFHDQQNWNVCFYKLQ